MIKIVTKYKTRPLNNSFEVKIWQETKVYIFGILVKVKISEEIK